MTASHKLVAPLVLALLAPAFPASAQAQGNPCVGNNRREPASMLIFPLYDAGKRGFSIHCVTNTDTTPAGFGQAGGTTNVMFEYVMADIDSDPLHPLSCGIVDRVETLTPADTLCVTSICHVPNVSEGYLVVTAQDPFQFKTDWSHNYLVGSEFVITFSGAVYTINAYGVKSPIPKGQPTDVSPTDGLRQLNGAEYDAVSDRLIIDNVLAIGRQDLILINLTGKPAANNTVRFDIWNDNEYPLSTVINFNCWFESAIDTVSPVFDQDFLANLPNDPTELDTNCDGVGEWETAWAFIDSINVSSAQGHVANDGALIGAVTTGVSTLLHGGRLLWESCEQQANGAIIQQ